MSFRCFSCGKIDGRTTAGGLLCHSCFEMDWDIAFMSMQHSERLAETLRSDEDGLD